MSVEAAPPSAPWKKLGHGSERWRLAHAPLDRLRRLEGSARSFVEGGQQCGRAATYDALHPSGKLTRMAMARKRLPEARTLVEPSASSR
jgi:hypothetical protein